MDEIQSATEQERLQTKRDLVNSQIEKAGGPLSRFGQTSELRDLDELIYEELYDIHCLLLAIYELMTPEAERVTCGGTT